MQRPGKPAIRIGRIREERKEGRRKEILYEVQAFCNSEVYWETAADKQPQVWHTNLGFTESQLGLFYV